MQMTTNFFQINQPLWKTWKFLKGKVLEARSAGCSVGSLLFVVGVLLLGSLTLHHYLEPQYVKVWRVGPKNLLWSNWTVLLHPEASKSYNDGLEATNDYQGPEHRMIVCAKVGDEMAYILEWLEFHRLQGVSKFVLYADDLPVKPRVTVDSLLTLKAVYNGLRFEDRRATKTALQASLTDMFPNLPTFGSDSDEFPSDRFLEGADLIDVHSISSLFNEAIHDFVETRQKGRTYDMPTMPMHRLGQFSLLKHCQANYGHRTEWLVHIDVDEFLYSPKYKTLTHSLESLYNELPRTRPAENWLQYSNRAAYHLGNLSSFYAFPINFGPCDGRILSPRVEYGLNSVTGTINIRFDPMVSRVIGSEQGRGGLEEAKALFDVVVQEPPSKLGEGLARSLQKERATIDYLSLFGSSNLPLSQPAGLPHQRRLEADFRAQMSLQTVAAAVSELASSKSINRPSSGASADEARSWVGSRDLLATNASIITDMTQRTAVASEAESQFENGVGIHRNTYDALGSLKRFWEERVKANHLFENAELAEGFDRQMKRLEVTQYPMIIESQVHRMPVFEIGDSWSETAENIVKYYPECTEYINLLKDPANKSLREKAATKERIKAIGHPPHAVCVPGELPSTLTNGGKSMYWYGRRFLPPRTWNLRFPQVYRHRSSLMARTASGFSGRVPLYNEFLSMGKHGLGAPDSTCTVPWAHHCGHKTWAPALLADFHDIRVDHHMTRSLEARTVGESGWRNSRGLGKYSVDGKVDFKLLKFVCLKEDSGKARFVEELRDALASFPLLLSDATLVARDNDLHAYFNDLECHVPSVLSGIQHPCPKSHPYVGQLLTATAPHSFVNRGWCHNVTIAGAGAIEGLDVDKEDWITSFGMPGQLLKECAHKQNSRPEVCQQLRRYFVSEIDIQNVTFCSGWPRFPCCDYDAGIAELADRASGYLGFQTASRQRRDGRDLSAVSWWRGRLIGPL